MLFSEPKIPQSEWWCGTYQSAPTFQCSSASRKFLNHLPRFIGLYVHEFQCSSASRKFLNLSQIGVSRRRPKCFSALQRAENSSMLAVRATTRRSPCFSALQRAENSSIRRSEKLIHRRGGFSALQRAENSSISETCKTCTGLTSVFQCSSASRKFLNFQAVAGDSLTKAFQCSSASRKFLNNTQRRGERGARVGFQCSSASRKFLNVTALDCCDARAARVSVLFSEPKIPQFPIRLLCQPNYKNSFSALQRAENSSISCGLHTY